MAGMERRTVQLRVAGQSCRVVTTANDADLKRSAGVVEAKLAELQPRGRLQVPNAMVLVALALAHELEETRDQSAKRDRRAREALRRVLERIDGALEGQSAASSTPATPS